MSPLTKSSFNMEMIKLRIENSRLSSTRDHFTCCLLVSFTENYGTTRFAYLSNSNRIFLDPKYCISNTALDLAINLQKMMKISGIILGALGLLVGALSRYILMFHTVNIFRPKYANKKCVKYLQSALIIADTTLLIISSSTLIKYAKRDNIFISMRQQYEVQYTVDYLIRWNITDILNLMSTNMNLFYKDLFRIKHLNRIVNLLLDLATNILEVYDPKNKAAIISLEKTMRQFGLTRDKLDKILSSRLIKGIREVTIFAKKNKSLLKTPFGKIAGLIGRPFISLDLQVYIGAALEFIVFIPEAFLLASIVAISFIYSGWLL
ncbi:MAG: hypothetical protein MHMPM18_003229, partial [Marteilia pararefringens]